MTRTTVFDPHAPEPVGPYSHAAVGADGTLFLSGQTPIDPSTGRLVAGDVAAQTRQVFSNLASVLSAAGRTLDDVTKVNVYLVDMEDFGAMNSVYSTIFTAPYPARTTVAVAGLPLGARVEIELVA
ncbi:2-iminobutanoate/2-iminopropanoate deaminase [Agromyces sp. 3263]|uniref:Rid family detoxifying hydrolase n=1 Tax=Agromyces sp. 3263 TaxID=2817750 RepID=UPI0028626442|nr:Rid family detoxifying hydrolase [Agromyces sp. 3263]MDR6905184.1 2-iminobutanoate/2-iminopropanoate deaminase [Agromyces sp. 3263]